MSVAAVLQQAGLLTPSYGADSISATVPAVAGALGVELACDFECVALARQWGLAPARAVIVVLIDGLGSQNLSDWAHLAPTLARGAGRGSTLRTGFPATTATSLAALGTGRGPGATGLVGYTARNPHTGQLATLVSWQNAGEASAWQREPHLFAQLGAHVNVTRIGPARFARSGLSQAVLTGGRYGTAEALGDRFDLAAYEATGGGFVYLYVEDVDHAGHSGGVGSPAWQAALRQVDREISRLARSVGRGTTIVVMADHGMINISGYQDVAGTPLLAEVDLLGGEPRALHLYSRRPEMVIQRWRQETDAVVLAREEAIAAGLFGPVRDHVRELIGDVVVAATGRQAYVDSTRASRSALAMVGHHGSLTPTEAVVPLVVLD